jgi:glycosyltransferase involved in cell wall biosynthesis
MKPKVTVGVCVRNCAATLREAIESIIHQDFPHEFMEVIFVDDGSEDETLSIINSYVPRMNMKVKVFHHEWKGLGASRNVVVDNASGDYIVWVDGDMILPKDHVRKQVEFMEKNPQVGIAKARYGTLHTESLLAFLENVGYVAVDCLYGGRPTQRTLGTGGSIYRVESIRSVAGFDDNISGVGEDSEAESRVRGAGWLLFLASPALFYERRRKSLVEIWREGFWHGYGGHYIYRKSRGLFSLFKLTPMASFLIGTWYSAAAYRATHRKPVFLLPFIYSFKRVAWTLGFVAGQLNIH